MAIVACKECTREISDKAERCPYCGVSITEPVPPPPRRAKPWLYGALIVVLLAWAAFTTLWLTGIFPVPEQLADFIGIGSGPVRSVETPEKMVDQVPLVKPADKAVYMTSLEQLYQDYDANEVAIQSKIGDSPIRVSGAVAEISEDTSGHPVVTLHSSSNNRADMVLSDDQRSAAAQLSKEDSVEIQCNKVRRIETRLHGSGCALVLVDAGANPVYLALSMSNRSGKAPLYIVGPMSRKTCLTSSDTIAAQVNSNPKNDRVLSKSCAATARESVSLENCHLSSTMPAIPDLPASHLWRYDCETPAVEPHKAAQTTASRGAPIRASATAATEAPGATVEIETLPTPASAFALPALSDVVAPVSKLDSSPGPAGVAAPASFNAGEAGGSPQPTAAAVSNPTSTAPTPSTPVADDLLPVRTKDPEAADHIVSYCSEMTSGAANPTVGAARCRQDEVNAWTRLVIQNEFPTLDAATRKKCNEPPFPDSFVARESCAKYQLRID